MQTKAMDHHLVPDHPMGKESLRMSGADMRADIGRHFFEGALVIAEKVRVSIA